jgi:asparagine synthase (glutamine-hydrolysing)
MSGIAGIYCLDDRSVDRQDLQKMVDSLSHRGPDGAAICSRGPVGLGHRMLWTTPESLIEKLPFSKNTLIITADARIDNRDELKLTIDLPDRPLEKISDSEFILAAYEKWGEDCPKHLLGDFAFAIWDEREQKLFCARDHFGVRPFYYYASPRALVFASEVKALFCLPEIPRQIDEVRIGDYLAGMFHDTRLTSYRDILRLPAAHSLTASPAGITVRQYWSLDPSRELHLDSDEAYATMFRDLFTQAVRCRLRSISPIGSLLSGGLDSSSITCMAHHLLQENGKTSLLPFSAVFDQLPDCDERAYIHPILAQAGLTPDFVQGDQFSPLSQLDAIFWFQDEAPYAPNGSMSWALYSAIHDRGVRVLLDGFDGDTTVSHGYGYLSELARSGQWFLLISEVKALAHALDAPFLNWLWSYVDRYGIQPTIGKYRGLRLMQNVWRKLTMGNRSAASPAWATLLEPDFAERIDILGRYQQWRQAQPHMGQPERERHYRNIATQGVPSFALEVLNKATAAFAIEARYPLWDKRLVEFCLALPPEQKLSQGWDRVVMRRAMTGLLPEAVQWRRGKTDFAPNLVNGLLRERDRLGTIIQNDSDLAGYVKPEIIQEIYQRFISKSSSFQLSNQSKKQSSKELSMLIADAYLLWTVSSLALWLRYTKGAPNPNRSIGQKDVDLAA